MPWRVLVFLPYLLLAFLAGCGDGGGNDGVNIADFQRFEKSHFGFFRAGGSYPYVAQLGVHWQRPHPGPFVWGMVEKEGGGYDWTEADRTVRDAQDHQVLLVATVWPYADWDQRRCHEKLPGAPFGFMPTLGDYRGKPCDLEAYQAFVRELVERYDGDGEGDMPGLVLPIKYWEVSNEPDLTGGTPFFTGDPVDADYRELLLATGKAIRESDPGAKVMNGGISALGDRELGFWQAVLGDDGASLVDVVTLHAVLSSPETNLVLLDDMMAALGLDQPVWVTEINIARGQGIGGHQEGSRGRAAFTPGEVAEQERWSAALVREFVAAFGAGADKLFYMGLDNATPTVPAARLVNCGVVVGGELEEDHLLLDDCVTQKPYDAYGTMVAKLDYFDSVEKIAAGQYRFAVGGHDVYVLWGDQPLPAEIEGAVRVTDIYGGAAEMSAAQVQLSAVPVYIERISSGG